MSTIFVYLDESGDLGSNVESKGTNYFVITLLVCSSQETRSKINTAVKRTIRKINHKNKKRPVQEFKGWGTVLSVKKFFLEKMPDQGWEIYSVVLNKRKFIPYLETTQGKNKLYNYLARFIIDKINFPGTPKVVNLMVDRSKDTTEIKEFNSYIKSYLQTKLPFNAYFNIDHEDSKKSYGIQAVDVFCWGIARRYEKSDLAWYKEFRDQITFETEFSPAERK